MHSSISTKRAPPSRQSYPRDPSVVLAWGVGIGLVAYGGILTGAELLVEAGAIHRSASADERALAWHAYLWDPWFLVWGLLVATALWQSRRLFAARLPDMIAET